MKSVVERGESEAAVDEPQEANLDATKEREAELLRRRLRLAAATTISFYWGAVRAGEASSGKGGEAAIERVHDKLWWLVGRDELDNVLCGEPQSEQPNEMLAETSDVAGNMADRDKFSGEPPTLDPADREVIWQASHYRWAHGDEAAQGEAWQVAAHFRGMSLGGFTKVPWARIQ